jgi:hypothetical protein
MKYEPKTDWTELCSQLPSTEGLAAYRALRHTLEHRPDELPAQCKRAFADLVLIYPLGLLDSEEANLVEKLCSESWRAYCEYHWGEGEKMSEGGILHPSGSIKGGCQS